jgi:hypothetical protein
MASRSMQQGAGTMKNLLEIFYVYDREVMLEAKESWATVLENTRKALQNTMAIWYAYDREVIDEAGDKLAATLCGKHV